MLGHGYRLIIPSPGLDRQAGGVVTLLDWGYETTALTATTGTVETWCILTGPQYPASGYGRIRWRFNDNTKPPLVLEMLNFSRPDLFVYHSQVLGVSGAEYLGVTYTTVQYELQINGLDYGLVTHTGETLIMPDYGEAPHVHNPF